MEVKDAFGAALRLVRLKRSLTQEAFSLVSSRTYVSMLERGATAPTVEKVEDLCSLLGVHPATLFTMTYLIKEGALEDRREFLNRMLGELNELLE